MSDAVVGSVAIGLFFVMLTAGFPIALAMAGSGIVGLLLLQPFDVAISSVALVSWQSLQHITLLAIPLFILLGNILIYSGLAGELMTMFSRWFSRFPGGLGVASIYSCAVLGAMVGNSSAAVATIGGVAIPEMEKRNYSLRVSCGCLCASGTLAILIPPSTEMIMYSVVSGMSVGHLFFAGLIPGICLATLFALLVMTISKFGSGAPSTFHTSWQSRFASLSRVWPAALLVLSVLGGIYLGVMTPTEAASVGAFIAWLLVTFYYRNFAWGKLWGALLATLRVSSMIFMIIVGAAILGYTLTLVHIPQNIAAAVVGISDSKWIILAVMCAIVIVAGCFLSVAAITFLIIPIFLPIVNSVGLDPLTFAMTYVILAETALITPPVGINLYIINGLVKKARLIEDIAWGAAPYLLVMVVMIAIIWLLPWLTHFLPSTL